MITESTYDQRHAELEARTSEIVARCRLPLDWSLPPLFYPDGVAKALEQLGHHPIIMRPTLIRLLEGTLSAAEIAKHLAWAKAAEEAASLIPEWTQLQREIDLQACEEYPG